MPFEQPPSPVAPPSAPPRPWAVPLSGGLGIAGLLAFAASDPEQATLAVALAVAATVATLVLSVDAFSRARPQPAPTALIEAAAQDDAKTSSWEAALEALPDPVLLIAATEPDDVAGRRIVFANAAAREFLRVPREGALLVTALRDPEVLEIVDEALFGRVPACAAYETGGAQDRFWRAWSRPLPSPSGFLALLSLRDETDARRMERMRADFLANASHELRTPLASLAGFIDTLKGHAKNDAEARAKFLDIMATQADRMRRLIADLLSLSRIELNEHVPPSGEADVSLIVTDVVDALTPLAHEKGVLLQAHMPPAGAATVCGDRDQIVQVVQNLVDNALKYSPEGSAVEIEVAPGLTVDQAVLPTSTRAARMSLLTPDRADDVRYVLIRVRDQGPGVARQFLPRLAERFYRVEGQKSGERLGTGLGLAIVKHIANRHRGGLSVESAPGEGSVFSVYLPRSEPRTRAVEPGRLLVIEGQAANQASGDQRSLAS
ncbi:MAG: PAS domain-containing protein [Proteobacteria bacterium]|nr:PAS domain-containing protein [Pseudomonadota bacterium]